MHAPFFHPHLAKLEQLCSVGMSLQAFLPSVHLLLLQEQSPTHLSSVG